MRSDLLRTRGALTREVGPSDSARAWGNDLDVLATPVLLWLTEVASMDLMRDALEPGEMSVGVGHDSQHLAPTVVGDVVVVESRFNRVESGLVVFDVEARDAEQLVLRGTHTRGVVSRERFLRRLHTASPSSASGSASSEPAPEFSELSEPES